MDHRLIFTALLTFELLWAGQPKAQDPLPPDQQIMTYEFSCNRQDISLKLIITFSQNRDEKLWSTSLKELKIDGAFVLPDESVVSGISTFAAIENVSPWCAETDLDIRLVGLNALAWEAFLREETDQRPGQQIKVIVISRDGDVRIRD